jgi:D-alanine-D-alanine ligase
MSAEWNPQVRLMRVGLSFDLKTAVAEHRVVEDAFEEYDSPETVNIVSSALQSAGNDVVRLGGGAQFLDNIRNEKIDIVFNIAEGRGTYRSREAQVPSVLEMLDVPYTGSDPLTLAVCLDKPVTKKLVAQEGVITPLWIIFNNESELQEATWRELHFPVIIKPAYEGSSKGIRLTSLAHDIRHAKEEVGRILGDYHQPVMVEEFIDGEEITIGVIGNSPARVVGIMRVVPKKKPEHFVYSLEVKRDYVNLVDYECPAALPQDVLNKLEESSLKAFRALGCRDFSRVDYRVSRDGTPYFIEINPLPGLGTYSDLVIMATMLGWTHEGLIKAVFEAACTRYPQCVGV